MKPNLYGEMNKSIVNLLEIRNDHVSVYAAARIEQLEKIVEQQRKTIDDLSRRSAGC